MQSKWYGKVRLTNTALQMTENNRLFYIDKLKALAMLLVVWGHTMYFCMYHEETISGDPLLNIICTFHVPLFFFLSGFVIKQPPTISKFMRKAYKFMLPMVVVGFVNALLFNGVKNFFLNGGHFGYWYLLTLTIFYLLLVPFRFNEKVILQSLEASSITASGLCFLCDIGMAVLFWIAMYFATGISSVVIEALNPSGAFSYWPFFIIGFICRKYGLADYIMCKARSFSPHPYNGLGWGRGEALLAIILVAAYLTMLTATFSSIDNLPFIIDLTIAFITIAALFTVFWLFDKSNTFIDRQLLLIGNSTLHIYIYHYFFIRLINLEFLTAQSILVEIAVTTLLTIAIAYVSIFVGKVISYTLSRFRQVFAR